MKRAIIEVMLGTSGEGHERGFEMETQSEYTEWKPRQVDGLVMAWERPTAVCGLSAILTAVVLGVQNQDLQFVMGVVLAINLVSVSLISAWRGHWLRKPSKSYFCIVKSFLIEIWDFALSSVLLFLALMAIGLF